MLGRSKNIILQIIDFFYFPFFRKFIPIQTFRYLACGGGNTLLNLLLFFVFYNYVFTSQKIPLGSIEMTNYIAAYIASSAITIPLGFLLSKYVVFQQSNLKGRVQLFRYMVLTITCFLLNYPLLHLFVGLIGMWATPGQALTSFLIAVFSYITQTFFAFKTKKDTASNIVKAEPAPVVVEKNRNK